MINKNTVLWGVIVAISVVFLLWFVLPVFATVQEDGKSNICHNKHWNNNKKDPDYEAIQVNNNALDAHLDLHGDFYYQGKLDKNGKPDNKDKKADKWCNDNVPVIPTPTPTPVDEEDEEEPTPTPTPFDAGSDGRSSNPNATKAPVCPNGDTTAVVANPHVWRNGTVATVKFFITEGDSANIYWRENNATDWQHAMSNVKPNFDRFVSVEIGELDANLGYTFAIEQVEGCGGGVKSVIVDPPALGQLFRLSYFE